MKIKDKLCKQCGSKFKPFNSLQPVCSPACAVKFNSKKEVNKSVKEMRKTSQSLNDIRAIARASFQTWIRLRDEENGCISCKKTVAKWDGGHYMKAEIFTGLIFEPINCNKQCSYCNDQLAGNLIEYRKGLIKKYGEAAVESLEARADLARMYKFSAHELIEITTLYKSKIKELKTQFNNAYPPVAEQIVK